jgi:hypothetical protein
MFSLFVLCTYPGLVCITIIIADLTNVELSPLFLCFFVAMKLHGLSALVAISQIMIDIPETPPQ